MPGGSEGGFKPVKLTVTLESLDEAEHFLRGLIIAQSNNSSQYFPQLIEGVNTVLEKSRAEELERTMAARREAGMP